MGKRDDDLAGRLVAWLERGEAQGPYCLQISPTMACDLNCVFCRRHDQMGVFYQAHREIEHCRYVALVREALDMGVRVVIIKGGGEPLLRRRLIVELAGLIKSRGVFGNLITNGTHLDGRVARALVGAGWDEVTVSLDGPDAATHDALRAKAGTFDRLMANLDRLNAVKRESGAALPRLGFHLVLTRANMDGIERFIELARGKGVEHVELDSMSPRFEETRPLVVDEEGARRLIDAVPRLIGRLERYGMTHNLDRFHRAAYVRREGGGTGLYGPPAAHARLASRIPCFYPFYQASITPAGSLVPCCYAEETHRSRANLNRVSFREAWFSGDAEEYRRSMSSRRMMPFCKNCTAMYADNNAELRRWLEEAEAHAGR